MAKKRDQQRIPPPAVYTLGPGVGLVEVPRVARVVGLAAASGVVTVLFEVLWVALPAGAGVASVALRGGSPEAVLEVVGERGVGAAARHNCGTSQTAQCQSVR